MTKTAKILRIGDECARVARVLEEDADATLSQIAQVCSLRPHQARYALQKLKAHKLFTRRVLINTYRLGLVRYSVFFSLARGTDAQLAKLVNWLVAHPHISLVLELGGDFHFEINVTAPSPRDLYQLLEELSARFPGMIHRKVVAIQAAHVVLGTRVLALPERVIRDLSYQFEAETAQIDALDKKILAEMSRQAPDTMRELATSLEIPVSTAEKRVRALMASGIIVRTTALLEFSELLHFVVLVYARSSSKSTKERILSFARDAKQVFYMVECLGPWDYEIGVTVLRASDAQSLVRQLYESLDGIIVEAQILPLFQKHKVQDYPGEPSSHVAPKRLHGH